MRVTVGVLVVLAMGLSASSARADWKMDRAQLVAATVWQNPCAGQVQIVIEPLADDAVANVHDDERPPYPVCRVHFNATAGYVLDDWLNLCTYMEHEYGHLADFHDPLN